MTEQELIDLGFQRQDEGEGNWAEPFYYYSYDFDEDIYLLTPAHDEIEDGKWIAQLMESRVIFEDAKELSLFINVIKRNEE